MLGVIAAALLVATIAVVIYVRREALGGAGLGMAALRTIGITALVLLLVNPSRTSRAAGGERTVLLDASLSMGAAGGQWARALDTARALGSGAAALERFGSATAPFDTLPPHEGSSRLLEPLTAARARGGAVVVVTDGELADAAALPPGLLAGVSLVVLPRDTAPDAALLAVDLPRLVPRDDSVRVTLTIGTWGALDARRGTLEVWADARRLLLRELELPPSPGRARREVALPPGRLPPGSHVLRFRLSARGDREPRDDERLRLLDVSEQPAVVVLVDPADWEGRFLVGELADIAQTTVRGYARAGDGRWLDMRTLEPAADGAVRAAARGAGLLVIRGPRGPDVPGRRGPIWRWPAGSDPSAEFFGGDWYVTGSLPPSPIAGRLAAVPWDSLPPLTGVLPLAPAADEWIGLRARQGRRGAARPVLVGAVTGQGRAVTTAGGGLWRWAFRGGVPREAYRALLAGGVEWLLGADAQVQRAAPLTASRVVSRGIPVTFRWTGDTLPDSTVVTLRTADSSWAVALRFGADSAARVPLEPGTYRWSAAGTRGTAVVEAYSDEFPPAPVAAFVGDPGPGVMLLVRHARERWWLYVIAILAFAGEWGWRQRRGLP